MDNIRDFLVIGDMHFKGGVDNVRRSDMLCDEIFRVVEERKPDFVVILGDTLDTFNRMYTPIHRRVCMFVNKLSTMVDKLYILIGNHDVPHRCDPPIDHGFHAYKISSNITIVDEPTEIEYKGYKYLAVPYYPPGTFMDKLSGYNLVTYEAIFSHQEFKGLILSKTAKHTTISTVGDKIPEDVKLVVNGHIHSYQFMKDVILNVGTPMQINHGDSDDNAVVFFKARSEDVPAMEWERVRLNIPKKFTLRVNYRELKDVDMSSLTRDTKVVVVCKQHHVPKLKSNHYYFKISQIVARIEHVTLPAERKAKEAPKRIVKFGDYFKQHIPNDLLYLYDELTKC